MVAKPKRILIVDDNADIRANLADILNEIGYHTETAADAESALAKVSQLCPDDDCGFNLCLLDFKMPGMDGVELFQKIREKNPGLRAIMITAYAGDDGVKRAEQAGTWSVLQKPVDIRKLLDIIDEAVTG